MDEHDQAMQWAQANSQDPRAQDIMAKAWAAKNPDDPRAAQINQKFAPKQDSVMDRIKDPEQWQGMIMGTGPKAFKGVKGNPPLAIPAEAAGSVINGLSKLLSSSAPRRIAVGAAQGAASDPEHPTWGAIKGGGTAAGLEAVGGLASMFGKGAKLIGQKLTGVTSPQAEAYAANHAEGERLLDMTRNDPAGLEAEMQSRLQQSRRRLQGVTAPERDELGHELAGKSISVNPAQFEGTAAGDEIKRAQALQPPAAPAPVEAPAQVDVVKPKDMFQKWMSQESRQAPPQFSAESTPAPRTPQSATLTGPQALRAKRASQQAADIKFQQNPQGYTAGNDPEMIAGSNLRKAMESVAPKSVAINDGLEQAARMNQAVKNATSTNPARILTESDSLGSMPIGQVRQYLDETTHSNYGELAKALDAAQAVNSEGKGLTERLVAQPVGRSLLRNSSRMPDAATTDNALLRQALLNATKR